MLCFERDIDLRYGEGNGIGDVSTGLLLKGTWDGAMIRDSWKS